MAFIILNRLYLSFSCGKFHLDVHIPAVSLNGYRDHIPDMVLLHLAGQVLGGTDVRAVHPVDDIAQHDISLVLPGGLQPGLIGWTAALNRNNEHPLDSAEDARFLSAAE